MKLDLGCGPRCEPGYVGVDRQYGPVFLNLETQALPYPANSVDAIQMHSALEHLSHRRTKSFLEDCLRVLKPGASMLVTVPDMEAVIAEWLGQPGPHPGAEYQNPAQERSEYLTWVIWGNQRPHEIEGQTHKNGFTAASLSCAFIAAGFQGVGVNRIVTPAHANQMLEAVGSK
jgi:ubiquinone/menaquinone biosynthesis C-methylase UbiE